jgi:hypothetical protein
MGPHSITLSIPDGMPILSSGGHRNAKEGTCFMEYTSVLAGLPFEHRPECTDRFLGAVMIEINDALSDTDRQRLTPLLGRCIGLVAPEHQTSQLRQLAHRILLRKLARTGVSDWVPPDMRYLISWLGYQLPVDVGLVDLATQVHEAFEEAMAELGIPNLWRNAEGKVEKPIKRLYFFGSSTVYHALGAPDCAATLDALAPAVSSGTLISS